VTAEEPKPEADSATTDQVGREVLDDLLRLMGIRAVVEARPGYELAEEDQPPPLVLNITGDDLGILIGRRGETLRALQYLVRLMVSHRLKQWTNLIIDVEGYLTRRRQVLGNLAIRVAERVERQAGHRHWSPCQPRAATGPHSTGETTPNVVPQSVARRKRR